MDRDLVESYVMYGIKSTKFVKGTCFAILLINAPLAVVEMNLYANPVLMGVVLTTLAINVITAFIFYLKWSAISGFLSQATQCIYLAIIINCFIPAIDNAVGIFVLYDYIITIALQIIEIPFILVIVTLSARKHNKGKIPKIYKLSLSVSISICALISLISKFLLTNVSLNVIVTIVNCLLIIMMCIAWYIVISAFYRAYLIKKYKLNIILESSII